MKKALFYGAVLLASLGQVLTSHKEHKVHNIVLYPDKHSWCKITPIKQVVAYPGCNSVEIDNNVCVGTCFSYSIPRTLPSAPGELIKPYCDSCQPSALIWKNLTLTCKGEDTDISEMQKSVQIIMNCSCSTCNVGDDSSTLSSFVSSGDGDIGPRRSHGQELMDWMMKTSSGAAKFGVKVFNTSANSNFSTSDPVMNEKLLILVKQLAGNDENTEEENTDREHMERDGGHGTDSHEPRLDRMALIELLQEVEGADHKVNKETLTEFVRQLEEREHIKVDLDRLRHALAYMQHELKLDTMQDPPENEHHNHHPQHQHHSQHHSRHSHQHQPLLTDDLTGELGGERLDVEPHHLKPALEGGELSYHDNLIATNENDTDTNKQEEF